MFNPINLIIAQALLSSLCHGQTYTTCNPTENSTCSADAALSNSTFSSDFTTGSDSNSSWSVTAGSITYGDEGAEFIINEKGDAPTIKTDFYIFFGLVEVRMKAASGTGIVSSIVMESDDLDEIDWEVLGSNTTSAETNYFGKGNTTTYDRAIYYAVDSPQTTFHTYTVNWTSTSTTWAIDGAIVRTLNYADALEGKNYPQTPMNLRLGIWAGGDSSEPEGTIEWAGGETDYSDAPFTMYVDSVNITNYNTGTKYVYGDKTGDWTSIKIYGDENSTTTASNTTKAATSSSASSASAASAASGEATWTNGGSIRESYSRLAWVLNLAMVGCLVVKYW